MIDRGGERVIAIFEMQPVPVADGVAAYDGGTVHDLPISLSAAVGYTLMPPVVGI